MSIYLLTSEYGLGASLVVSIAFPFMAVRQKSFFWKRTVFVAGMKCTGYEESYHEEQNHPESVL